MITHGEMEFEVAELEKENAELCDQNRSLRLELEVVREERDQQMDYALGIWVGMCTAAAIYDWAVAVKGMVERMKIYRECGHELEPEPETDMDRLCWGGTGYCDYECDCPGFKR